MRSLYKATFFYFMGNILTRFSGFILIPLYTNILSTSEYGNYGLLMAVYAILNVLYQAGLFQGFIKFFYDKGTDPSRVVSTTLNTIILFGFVVALLLSIFYRPLAVLTGISIDLSSLLLIIFWLILFDTLAYFGLHFLKTKKMARHAVSYSLITAVANLILNIIFLVVLRLNILGILLAQGLSNLLLLSLTFRHVRRYYLLLIDWTLLRKLFSFSLPLVIAGFFGIMMSVADRFIIDYFMDRSEVGLYSLAYKLGLLMNVFVIAFRTAYLPHFLSIGKPDPGSRIERETLISELRLTLIKFIGLISILFLAVVILLQYLFKIEIAGFFLINPDYIKAAYIVPFILLAYAFNGLAAFFSLAPYMSGKSFHFVITDVIGFTVNITLNFLLIPHYGIMGAALATLVGYYSASLYMYFVFTAELKKNIFGREVIAIITGCLISLYAASVSNLLPVRLLLMLLFMIFCLKISKMSLKSFFRLTVKEHKHN